MNMIFKRSLAGALAILCVAAAAPANLTVAFFPQTAFAESAEELLTEGDFDYRLLDDGTVEIAAYNGTETEVTVPAEIDGVTVTSIGRSAFSDKKNIVSVSLPDTITNISISAFCNCHALKNINIPEGVEVITYEAFSGCGSLVELTLPESVKEIEPYAFGYASRLKKINIPKNLKRINSDSFSHCSALTELYIPENVDYIGERAFEGCLNLKSIKVAEGNSSFKSFDDALYAVKGNDLELLCCPCGKDSIAFPDNVTVIRNCAFELCRNLNEIIIPDTVKTIGSDAFYECYNITKLTIPEGVKSIYPYTFEGCKNLSELNLPDSITKIGEGAFVECRSLKSIVLPKNITFIGRDIFNRCNNLETAVLSGTITEIPYGTFSYCGKLNKVVIPASVTKIADAAFQDCYELKDVYYGGSKSDWEKVVIGKHNYILKVATVHYGCTSPEITKVQYSEQYHQVRINWSPVDDAEQYGIAVFLAGKWRVQTQAIPSSVTSFTTPKNLTPGTSYKIAVAAKIGGKWDVESAVNKAVTVTVK